VVGPKLKLYEGLERLGMPLAHHSCNGFFDGAFGLIQIRQPFADRRRNFINGRSAASQLSNGDPEDPARLVTQEQGLPEPVVSHRDGPWKLIRGMLVPGDDSRNLPRAFFYCPLLWSFESLLFTPL